MPILQGLSERRKRREKNIDGADGRGPTGLRLLHASARPLVDLIFVHGLRGGSVKTWRKGSDPSTFWPKFWLPSEPGFDNVNIHSFGYDSDWASTERSILDVHAFGQNLLEEMRNFPSLRDHGERPIIMIGHSMGGLVIKKAFVLGQNVPEFNTRIRCIFFLATPHRGSDYAATLNNILAVTGFLSQRQYIQDLVKRSASIQPINDDFGKHAHDLPIFSFFETLRTNIGVSSAMIVDKDSAVLGPGYSKERVQYINANHRDICKYSSPDDPNYITVKNALAGAVADILRDVVSRKVEEQSEQLRVLRAFLGVFNGLEEQYQKVEGSCEWIDAREDFRQWRDGPLDSSCPATTTAGEKPVSIFWVHANPGTGKTILSSHVVSQLRHRQLEYAYHYFHSGDRVSGSLDAFLRSIAYQMAVSNASIRGRLVKMAQDSDGTVFDLDDSRAIWVNVFRKTIFQIRLQTPQYWVIDALDECNRYQGLFTMLKGERLEFPLRIFVTSRMVGDMQRLQRSVEPSASLICIEIPIQDTLDDIQRYVSSRINDLPVDSGVAREELANTILRKSNGCFLWVRLVIDELETAYSNESIVMVLEKIPEGMHSYYERTVKAMETITLDKHIAKAVLMWVATSARRLTTAELSQALKLDIKAVLPSAKSAVEGLCGQLVAIDRNSDVVHLIHPTVGEFLASEAAGEFTISKPLAHERIALTCLQLLAGNEMRPPRSKRLIAHARPAPSPFLDYVLTQFSEHIASASPENDKLLTAIDRFFKTNVLSWIERLAATGNLHSLIRTSKNLKSYLDRRARNLPSSNSQMKSLERWSVDLTRIATRLGQGLLESPSSIYFLIPPLCPSRSAIYEQFGKRPDGLVVVGQKSSAWDDCTAHVSFVDDGAVTVSCGEGLIAVGMASGNVNIYDHRSCQKQAVISHKHPVYLVHLVDNGVISCTSRFVILHDLAGNVVWEQRLRFQCLYLTSSGHCIIAVTQHGHLLKWNKSSGDLLENLMFKYRNYDVNTQQNGLALRAPHVVSISPDMETLALGYRGGTICLWEIKGAEFIDWAREEKGREAAALLFNPNPNISLLLAIYTDHGMALFDTWSGTLVHARDMPQEVALLSAACSPDGRTLVTLDTQSNIRIWDFEAVGLLHHVVSHSPGFRILNFTSDGSSIIDVVDSRMRVLSPAVLVRETTDDDASIRDEVIHPVHVVAEGEADTRKANQIKALSPHPSLPIVVAGKYNGQVVAFDSRGGETAVLFSHPPTAPITGVAMSKDSVASSDLIHMVQVWMLTPSFTEAQEMLFETHAMGQVKQLCFSANGEYLLVATTRADCVYRVHDGTCIGTLAFEAHERRMWRWLLLPQEQETADQQHFALLVDGVIRTYEAQTFPQLVEGAPEVHIHHALDHRTAATGYGTVSACSHKPGQSFLAVEVRHHSGLVSSSTTFLYDLSAVWPLTRPSPTTPPASPAPPAQPITLKRLCPALSKCCKHLLGFSHDVTKGKCSVIFIHQNSWVCSIHLPVRESEEEQGIGHYTQHFFVPREYLARNPDMHVSPVKAADDDVVFSLQGDLVSIRNGMQFQETKAFQ